MRKFLLLALAMVTLCSNINAAQKKEKAKKEKKEITWEWDGTLSENEVIDDYLLCIDTLYNKVQAYKNDFGAYKMKMDTIYVNGKTYALCSMTDETGNILSRSRINWQFAQAYGEGALIILDMTNAGLSSANAALALPQLGLKALNFAKYVKSGASSVLSQGLNTIKTIRGQCIQNSRTWKEMKNGAIEDAASIGYEGFSSDVTNKLNKCFYVKEIQVESSMTPEEMEKHTQEIIAEIDKNNILPEDKSKMADEIPDLEEELQQQG